MRVPLSIIWVFGICTFYFLYFANSKSNPCIFKYNTAKVKLTRHNKVEAEKHKDLDSNLFIFQRGEKKEPLF